MEKGELWRLEGVEIKKKEMSGKPRLGGLTKINGQTMCKGARKKISI